MNKSDKYHIIVTYLVESKDTEDGDGSVITEYYDTLHCNDLNFLVDMSQLLSNGDNIYYVELYEKVKTNKKDLLGFPVYKYPKLYMFKDGKVFKNTI